MAKHDLVDIVRSDAGMLDRLRRSFDDHAFECLVLVPAERQMRPTDDASSHDRTPIGAAK
jgi:hypothetical protein